MSKESRQRVLGDNEAIATMASVKISPRKLSLIAAMIRRKKVDEALNILTFSRKRAANDVIRLLQSAVANAENNHRLDIDNLYISEVRVGKSLLMKRWRARARGRSAKIMRRFSRLSIVLREGLEEILSTRSKKQGSEVK